MKAFSIDLSGAGAAYIRVSTDQQDTERQFAAIRSFEKLHSVTIPTQHWYKDEGWARDQADKRPDFQRLMKLAEAGAVKWIVVDQLDRFGTRDAYQLISYLHRLREGNCKLYDATGREWTSADIATIITAVVEGEKSKGEQTDKSHRVLGGKVAKARAGEWQGGPVSFAFDVGCFHRETGTELWRVSGVGKGMRLKTYPDGRTERFDDVTVIDDRGEEKVKPNFPSFQPLTEVLRITPTKDKAKISAAVSVFKRFATESVSLTNLAKHLNDLGYRTSHGGYFQSHHIERMLSDTAYIGYYAYNRSHCGKFHRYKGNQTVLDLNYDEKVTKNNREDWVLSSRLFNPLVDQKTWDAVKTKLEKPKRVNAPRNGRQYLSGIVYCGNCGAPMCSNSPPLRKNPRKDGYTGQTVQYFCSTYFKAVREGRTKESTCLRNLVFQDTLEKYIVRYLDESGTRLEILMGGNDADNLTSRLEASEADHWKEFRDGIKRLTSHLAINHPAEYARIIAQDALPVEEGGSSPDDFVANVVKTYRELFDPAKHGAELAKLETAYGQLLEEWRDLPTAKAKEAAKKRFLDLEKKIDDLKSQQANYADVVAQHYREMSDLQTAIANAKIAMKSAKGETALRQRAEAIRAIIQRIECTFVSTGTKGSGWGKRCSELSSVTIYPVVGDSARYLPENATTRRVRSCNQAPIPS